MAILSNSNSIRRLFGLSVIQRSVIITKAAAVTRVKITSKRVLASPGRGHPTYTTVRIAYSGYAVQHPAHSQTTKF